MSKRRHPNVDSPWKEDVKLLELIGLVVVLLFVWEKLIAS